MDDILIYPKTQNGGCRAFKNNIGNLEKEMFNAKFSNSEFWLEQGQFLGRIVSKDAYQ